MDSRIRFFYNGVTMSFLFLFVSVGQKMVAQSLELKSLIKKEYDFSKIGSMQVDLEFDYEVNRAKTMAMAKANNLKIKEVLPNGKKVELQEIGHDGSPIYYETYADNASQTSRASALHNNGLLNLDLDGLGMEVGVWDAGVAMTTHQEYDVRAHVGDGGTEIDAHATMVTGSLISSGIKRNAQGVAYRASVLSHDWTRDKIEVAEAAANGLLLSNHSYGIKTDRVPDWYFGSYIKVAQDWDNIMYNAPYYLMVTAAGNARHSGDNESPVFGTSADGFDLLLGFTVAKNGLTVAGSNSRIDTRGNLKEASVSAYSSYGPVDDGRIKPDLAGDGSSILSTDAKSETSYDISAGTSMATPGVTGALLLLQQYNEQLYGSYLKAATLKGLALHTADDVDAPGPDYKMGWGVMNAKRAAEVLHQKEFSTQILENTLVDGEIFELTVKATEGATLMASISWTDPASEYINRGELNDGTPALVNDLDIRITQDGKTFLPWKLNPKNPNAPAEHGDNRVDPFEKIEIPNALGTYTIIVSHKRGLLQDKQDYSLIVSGASFTECSLNSPSGLSLENPLDNKIMLKWNEIVDGLYEVQYRKESEGSWISIFTTTGSKTLSDLVLNESYVVRVRTFCSQNIASEFSMEYKFTFDGPNTVVGLLDTFQTLSADQGISFSVYPNPAVNQISLLTEVGASAMYRIISPAGIELKVGTIEKEPIPVADLATGMYILQIKDGDTYKSTKFFKN
ncbi:T9SS C-terminal target domain-containing protein [Maribacter algicola]|uniref:T9SS C-terminal target domain-containing protein n=1 Tax=Maribacter algicola TaxID=2498892 RepID=A0A426RLQ0_9FLAO|nr:S8 family serine peptidase [Maribacter algicola]RRQ49925.1 T9SS C-terminal target domain-containing protein [Maribacter algicola]